MITSMVVSQIFRIWVIFLFAALFLGGSNMPPGDEIERVRAFTRAIEYDFVDWTIDAMGIKLGQAVLGTERYLTARDEKELVTEYLDLIRRIQEIEAQRSDIYADPNIEDPEEASRELQQEQEELHAQRDLIEPLAESIVQNQIADVVAGLDLDLGGQPVPPILYRTTYPPAALIVSPREEIVQIANISIDPQLTVDEHEILETRVDQALSVSTLVVPIGGIGIYPTMVQQTTNLNWLAEVVAHEWVHNFLTMRPLGISFMVSPELRTMNETAAAIAGKEIGLAVIKDFYPELVPPEPSSQPETQPQDPEPQSPPPFDFRAEMRETRENADRLLAEGKIEQAEHYMELRRRYLWDHGYHIRKLNQAYFAFHGAYADQPGGAAGEDPVGEAVRALREQSSSLSDFLKRISWMWSADQLNEAVSKGE